MWGTAERRAWQKQNREHLTAYQKQWREKNREHVNMYARNVYKAKATLRCLEKIAGRPRAKSCDPCHKKGKTVFDHCHVTGRFRGWLCVHCNALLGMANDSTDFLKLFIAYLEDHRV